MGRDLSPLARARGPLAALFEQRALGDTGALVEALGLPLAERLAERARAAERCLIVGLAGGQGTGKSTLARVLQTLLKHGFDVRSVVVSLDDYYLPRAARDELARRVHPLLATRGVPGTHDLARLQADLPRLCAAGSGEAIELPRFSKAHDDRAPDPRRCHGAFDLVIFEGWCVGARAQSPAALAQPINLLERDEDPDGTFRRYVNDQLAQAYAVLWRKLDGLIFLAAPDLTAIRAFRAEQERALQRSGDPNAAGLMNDAQLQRFVDHFERITTHMLSDTPCHADIVAYLGADRSIRGIVSR